MYNYTLVDANNKILGVISLENEELPKAIMEGCKFGLGAAFACDGNTPVRVIHFIVAPEPAKPAFHRCELMDETNDASVNLCIELEDGSLIATNGEYESTVNYCPFCGFRSKLAIDKKE